MRFKYFFSTLLLLLAIHVGSLAQNHKVVEFYLNGQKIESNKLSLASKGKLEAKIKDSTIIYNESYPIKLLASLSNGYVSFNTKEIGNYEKLSETEISQLLEGASKGQQLVFGFTNTEPAVRVSFRLY